MIFGSWMVAFRAQNTILSDKKAPAGRLSVIPKPKYMTLGPKFYTKLVSSITRRRKQVRRNEVHFQYTFSCALQDFDSPEAPNLTTWLVSNCIFRNEWHWDQHSIRNLFRPSPEELQVGIFTELKFVKIRTCSSSGLAFCVELWTKQVSYRNLVPMSYISV